MENNLKTTKPSASYKDILKEKECSKLLLATMISRFGDSVDVISFSWLTYSITGSPEWLAVIFGVNSLPSIVLQPFAGVWIEKLNKKVVMVIADACRAACVMVIVALYLSGGLTPWSLLCCTFLNSVFEAFRMPATVAIYPQIIGAEKYPAAVSLNTSLSRIMEVVGMGGAGMLISLLGIAGTIFLDGMVFLMSAVILCFIKETEGKKGEAQSNTTFLTSFREGISYLRAAPILLVLCFLNSFTNGLIVPMNSFQAAYISDVLEFSVNSYAVSSAVMSLGLSIGSFLYPVLAGRIDKWKLLVGGGMTGSLSYLGFAVLSKTGVETRQFLLIVISLVFGLAFSLVMMSVNISFMRHVEEGFMARTSGLLNAITMGSVPLVSAVCSAAASVLDINTIFTFAAVLGLILFAAMHFVKTLEDL